MNRYSLFQGRQAGTASERVCYLANSGSGGCGFCPAKRWTRKCRVSGAGREGANDVSIRNMFCSVPTLCSLVSLLSSQLQLSLICGVGCAHLIVRLAWTLATPLALFFPSQKWTALLLRNRQRGSGKTCSRNQEPPEVRAPWARGNQMGFERKSSPHKHVRYQRSSCRVRDGLEPAPGPDDHERHRVLAAGQPRTKNVFQFKSCLPKPFPSISLQRAKSMPFTMNGAFPDEVNASGLNLG